MPKQHLALTRATTATVNLKHSNDQAVQKAVLRTVVRVLKGYSKHPKRRKSKCTVSVAVTDSFLLGVGN